MYPDLSQYPYFGYDTETSGLRYPQDKAFACAIATPDGRSWYFDFRHQPLAIEWLNDQFSALLPSWQRVICHNAPFDACMSAGAGIHIPLELLDDTVIRASLIDEHIATMFPWTRGQPGNFTLDYLCRKYIGKGKFKIDIDNIENLPDAEVRGYTVQDAILALELWQWQQKQIDKQELHDIAELERRAMPCIIRSQMAGIRVDLDAAERAMEQMTPHINKLQSAMDVMADRDFNVNSHPQVKTLFDPVEKHGSWWVGNTQIGTTKKGGPSFGKEHLERLAEVDPSARQIISIRSALKTRDTFLAKHILEHAVGDRVFPTINQTVRETGGTKWGRLSYVNPAMQQIPNRDKVTAAIVKPCFLPDEGQVWVDNDLASFEVRVFAALAGMYNDHLVKEFQKNPHMDFHQYVADLTKLRRDAEYGGQPNAKQLNLSMIFCQGAGATAAKMGLPTTNAEFHDEFGKKIRYQKAGDEALKIIEQYHRKIKGVRELAKAAEVNSRSRGFITTKFGRRLRFPKGYKVFKASGILIQATSADINKENWCLIDEALDGRGRMILNTHDSYSLSCDINKWEEANRDVRRVVERDFLGVPLLLDFNGMGPNWWAALQDKGIGNVVTVKRNKRNRTN